MKPIKFSIAAGKFKKILKAIENTTAKEGASGETRQKLCGVLLEFEEDEIRFISSNGVILAIQTVKVKMQDFSGVFSCFIPFRRKGFQEIDYSKLNVLEDFKIKTEKADIFFLVDEKTCEIAFAGKKYKYESVLKYPDYKQAIQKTLFSFEIKTKSFIDAITRSLIYANKTANTVNFQVENNTLHVKAKDTDYGHSSHEWYDIETNKNTPKDFEFALNGKFAKTVFSVLSDCEYISINFSGATNAFTSSCHTTDIRTFILLMPTMLEEAKREKYSKGNMEKTYPNLENEQENEKTTPDVVFLNKVIEIDETAFEPFDKGDYKEFSDKVNAFLKQYWRSENDFDTITNTQSGFVIGFDNTGIDELSGARRGETKMKALSQIKRIIEDASLFTVREDKTNNTDFLAIYTFIAYIKYKGIAYEYQFVVKHKVKGKFIYAVNLDIRKPLN